MVITQKKKNSCACGELFIAESYNQKRCNRCYLLHIYCVKVANKNNKNN